MNLKALKRFLRENLGIGLGIVLAVIGGLVTGGVKAQDGSYDPSACLNANYLKVSGTSGGEAMYSIGQSLVLQGTIGQAMTLSHTHGWRDGFTVYVGNLPSTSTVMSVSETVVRPVGGVYNFTPSTSKTFIAIEIDCEGSSRAITSKTTNTSGAVTALQLAMGACSAPMRVQTDSGYLPSVLLAPFAQQNDSTVAGLEIVLPESRQTPIWLLIQGNKTKPVISGYTGGWQTSWYFANETDENGVLQKLQATFGYDGYMGTGDNSVAAVLANSIWLQQANTSFMDVPGTVDQTSTNGLIGFDLGVYPVEGGVVHNGLNLSFRC